MRRVIAALHLSRASPNTSGTLIDDVYSLQACDKLLRL